MVVYLPDTLSEDESRQVVDELEEFADIVRGFIARYETERAEQPKPAKNACHCCGGPWSVSSGPGRIVGAIARNFVGIRAPLPDDFEFEYCPPCEQRNMTDELEARFLAVEREYLKSLKDGEVNGDPE
jgi:hypothetical protein